VIEDDEAISSLIELSLEARGAQVLVVSKSEQLLRVLEGSPVLDVALVDLSPVAGHLVEALDRLEAASPGVIAVLMSGQPTGIPAEADGRFAAWVRKPFDMDQLLSTVGELLQAR
jgi:DNA-binding NtrC family response regulator